MKQRKRLILILGPAKVGKTTVVQKVMALSKRRFGGFFTLANQEAKERDFKLVTVLGREKGVPDPSHKLISPCAVENVTTFNLDELESRGVTALHSALSSSEVVVVDELGAMQLHSPTFKRLFEELLASTAILIVTGNDKGLSYFAKLKKREDCVVFPITAESRCTIPDKINDHLHELLD